MKVPFEHSFTDVVGKLYAFVLLKFTQNLMNKLLLIKKAYLLCALVLLKMESVRISNSSKEASMITFGRVHSGSRQCNRSSSFWSRALYNSS